MGLFDLLNGIAGARSRERMDAIEPDVPTTIPGENNPQVTEPLGGEGLEGLDPATMKRLTEPVPLPVESAATGGHIDNPVSPEIPPVPDVVSAAPAESLQFVVNSEVAPSAPSPEASVDPLGTVPSSLPLMSLDEVMSGQNPTPAVAPDISAVEKQPHFVGTPTIDSDETPSSSSMAPADVPTQEGVQGLTMPDVPIVPSAETFSSSVSSPDAVAVLSEAQGDLGQVASSDTLSVLQEPIVPEAKEEEGSVKMTRGKFLTMAAKIFDEMQVLGLQSVNDSQGSVSPSSDLQKPA